MMRIGWKNSVVLRARHDMPHDIASPASCCSGKDAICDEQQSPALCDEYPPRGILNFKILRSSSIVLQ